MERITKITWDDQRCQLQTQTKTLKDLHIYSIPIQLGGK